MLSVVDSTGAGERTTVELVDIPGKQSARDSHSYSQFLIIIRANRVLDRDRSLGTLHLALVAPTAASQAAF